MELKIMELNIRGSAALPWLNNYTINPEIVDKIMEQDADIVVVTEFCVSTGLDYFQGRLKEKYIWFMNYSSGKNGILICIKLELFDDRSKLPDKDYFKKAIFCRIDDCNILQISLPIRGKKLMTIVGCRMETGGNVPLRKQYDDERKAFDEVLMPTILKRLNNSDFYIVCGDFNNARCLGNLNEKFNPQNYIKDSKELAQYNYNLNIIKDKFDDNGFEMMDNENGEPINTYKDPKNYDYPNDHIFVYGLEKLMCDVVTVDGLSDHDIILAKVKEKERAK